MNIVSAKGSSVAYSPGDTIQGSSSLGIMDGAGAIMPKVTEVAEKLDTLITSLNRLVSNPQLTYIINNVEKASEDLTVTTRRLNALLGHDIPQLAATYNKAGENIVMITENFKSLDLKPTLDSVNATISNVNGIMRQMTDPDGTIGALMSDRGLYDSMNRTVNDMDSLMIDLKANPKRYVHFSVFGRKNK